MKNHEICLYLVSIFFMEIIYIMESKAGVSGTIVIKTDMPGLQYDDEALKLIIVSKYEILMQGSEFFYEAANIIYKSIVSITGIDIHIAKELMFITDETGTIYKASLTNTSLQSRVRIYSPESANIPLGLSVDWLNDKLYILFESSAKQQKNWIISRCNFDGNALEVVYSGLQSKPIHFQVDPMNGYLFWSLSGENKNVGGLFRLDLSKISSGFDNEFVLKRIFDHHGVGVFVIDFDHRRIAVPIENFNTVISLDSNGANTEVIRKNTQNPVFSTIKSISMAKGQFYWTGHDGSLMEEYHKMSQYNHVNWLSVYVNLPSAQPTPKPMNPPNNVHALLSVNRAKLSWHTPSLLNTQGHGAWKDWNYEVEILDLDNNDKKHINQIKGLHYIISDLRPNTEYGFRVIAYSNAGYSPYSAIFYGRTHRTPSNSQKILTSNNRLNCAIEINLSWLPVEEINGPRIWYQNNCKSKNSYIQLLIKDSKTSINMKLLRDHTYNLCIQFRTTQTFYNQCLPLNIVPQLIDSNTTVLIFAVFVSSFAVTVFAVVGAFCCVKCVVSAAFPNLRRDKVVSEANIESASEAQYEEIEDIPRENISTTL